MGFHLRALALVVPFASGGLALGISMVNSLPYSGHGSTVSEDSSDYTMLSWDHVPLTCLIFLFALSPFDTVCFSR